MTASTLAPEATCERTPITTLGGIDDKTQHGEGTKIRMNRKLLLLLIGSALVVGFIGWSWNTRLSSQPFRIVVRGSTKSSDRMKISGGNLVVIAPEPGLFFGTVRKPGEEEQFTYLIVFRYGLSEDVTSPRVMKSRCTSEGRTAETRNSIELGGKRIEVAYRLELNETLTAAEQERLTIDGETVDVALGRVFLIDISAEQPEYLQRRIDLPVIDSSLETTNDVERIADTLRTILSRHPR